MIPDAKDVWKYLTAQRVVVDATQRSFTIEIPCASGWDDEHLLGIRLKADRFVDLCGSIL